MKDRQSLTAAKENEYMEFLRAEAARLRMNIPAVGAVRDTIDFLFESIPDWNGDTAPEEFAKLMVKRYPELRFEWTSGEDSDEPATAKQISFLKVLGAPIPNSLGIREASDLIEEWKNRVSDGQKRRLDFYGLAYAADITREQATALIDDYKKTHPESEAAYQEWKAKNDVV